MKTGSPASKKPVKTPKKAVKKRVPVQDIPKGPPQEVRATLGKYVLRLWFNRADAINTANSLTKLYGRQHDSEYSPELHGWYCYDRTGTMDTYDVAGKLPRSIRMRLPRYPGEDTRRDLDILGEFAVYPGHPVTIAVCIVETYRTFEDAFAITESNWAAALGATAVPGAGGCVASALVFLRSLKSGMAFEAACAGAAETWAHCDDQRKNNSTRWQEGQEQADRFKEKLAARSAWWTS
jgi:hypothetical protein